jgi:hypothetical protein
MTKQHRTIEKPEGRGIIRLADGQATSVRYSLVVFQTVDDEADTGEQAGQLEIRGALEVNQDQGQVDLDGKGFTLETNDGRCLKAWARQVEPASRRWEMVATGPAGLKPC